MRYWDDKDGNGNKLTDGRICLVIKSESDPDMPEIRTYGKDQDEVLDKLARTTETGQATIHRMRKQAPAPVATRTVAATSPTDVAAAVVNLSNPATAVAAVKTLLKAGNFDVDANAQRDAIRKVADIGQAWEKENPSFPHDPRNQRMLIDRAIILAGGKYLNVTAKELDIAFEQLTRDEMFFEPKAVKTDDGLTTVQPDGNSDSRTVRNATTYRRNALRSPEIAAAPAKDNAKETKWRNILENGSSKALGDAIANEPGFKEWVNNLYAKTA